MISKRTFISLCVAIVIAAIGVFSATITVRSEGEEATKITILMNEYTFQQEGQQEGLPITVIAGQLYSLTLKNTGKFVHEIWLGKDPIKQADGHVDGYATGLFDGVEMTITGAQGAQNQEFEISTKGLTEVVLNPDQSITLAFTLPDSTKGKWEIGCFQPMPMPDGPTPTADPKMTPMPMVTHYFYGMKETLIVK
ncbi:MAG: hypothetical protein ABI947_13755 [Chloroflexota bacterium]